MLLDDGYEDVRGACFSFFREQIMGGVWSYYMVLQIEGRTAYPFEEATKTRSVEVGKLWFNGTV